MEQLFSTTLGLDKVFIQVAVILTLAGLFATVANWLKQPLLIGYMAMGVLATPLGLGWLQEGNEVKLLSKIGVTVLMFLVGLKLDFQIIRNLGKVALATGIGQVFFTAVFGFLICLGFGFPLVAATYIAIALTFSSTIIIVKLLSDKRELESLHGRIAVGILIVQDIIVILLMATLSSLGKAVEMHRIGLNFLHLLGKGIIWVAIVAFFMRYILTLWTKRLSQSKELLMLFALTWAIVLACLGQVIGFSSEVGAFIAGVALASTPYKDAIGARFTSMRDFLLPFFFFDLGSHLQMRNFGEQLGIGTVLSLFVLIGNPLIVIFIMAFMGYRNRTSFLTGLTVAQISEFSLLLGSLGLSLGHITEEDFSLITLVGFVTIAISTYLILYSLPIYRYLSTFLSSFERKTLIAEYENQLPKKIKADVIVIGMGRYGLALAKELKLAKYKVIGIDIDSHALELAKEEGIKAYYGDIEDNEFIEILPLDEISWLITTVPFPFLNHLLFQSLKELNYHGLIAAVAYDEWNKKTLKEAKVDQILDPYQDAASEAVQIISS